MHAGRKPIKAEDIGIVARNVMDCLIASARYTTVLTEKFIRIVFGYSTFRVILCLCLTFLALLGVKSMA